VAVGVLTARHPLLEPARRRGVNLLARPDRMDPPSPAAPKPPILR
jgi:hypothetical protein